jgi:molecular chaperone GrpE (heat shock protein)
MPEDVENTEVEQEVDPLEALQSERDELLDTLQRVQAEFDNYRKRAAGGPQRHGV